MLGKDCEDHRGSTATPGRVSTLSDIVPIVGSLTATDGEGSIGRTVHVTGGVR
jgi:hypothetical protein